MKKIVAVVLALVMVLGLATTAFGATAKVKFYAAGNGTGYTDGWSTTPTEIDSTPALMLTEADYDYDAGAGNLDYYTVDTVKYVVADKAVATHKLVYGATTIYLVAATNDDVLYSYQAEVFTNVTEETDECGKLVVSDDSKTYYVVKNDKGVAVGYYVKATAGTMKLLVDGKIVKTNTAGTAIQGHFWAGNDIDATTKAYTSVKCEECGKV